MTQSKTETIGAEGVPLKVGDEVELVGQNDMWSRDKFISSTIETITVNPNGGPDICRIVQVGRASHRAVVSYVDADKLQKPFGHRLVASTNSPLEENNIMTDKMPRLGDPAPFYVAGDEYDHVITAVLGPKKIKVAQGKTIDTAFGPEEIVTLRKNGYWRSQKTGGNSYFSVYCR